MRIVLDANVIVSAAFFKGSIAYQIFTHVVEQETLILSESTFDELQKTLYKQSLEKYFYPDDTRPLILAVVLNQGKIITPDLVIDVCRDPKDNVYLELAVTGKAQLIVSGDKDLLELNPFRGIEIISPREFHNRYCQD